MTIPRARERLNERTQLPESLNVPVLRGTRSLPFPRLRETDIFLIPTADSPAAE